MTKNTSESSTCSHDTPVTDEGLPREPFPETRPVLGHQPFLYGVGLSLLILGVAVFAIGFQDGHPNVTTFGLSVASLGGFWFFLGLTFSMIRVPK